MGGGGGGGGGADGNEATVTGPVLGPAPPEDAPVSDTGLSLRKRGSVSSLPDPGGGGPLPPPGGGGGGGGGWVALWASPDKPPSPFELSIKYFQ